MISLLFHLFLQVDKFEEIVGIARLCENRGCMNGKKTSFLLFGMGDRRKLLYVEGGRLVDALRPPLTREGAGSEADYWRLTPLMETGAVSREQVANRMCTPHTWHAAEMFLYLLDLGRAAGAGGELRHA